MSVSQGAREPESGLHRSSGSETCTQEEEEANNLVSYDSQEALPEDTSTPKTLGRLTGTSRRQNLITASKVKRRKKGVRNHITMC